MGKRIAFVGVGALGGYVGGYLAHHGHDVTLIDMWPRTSRPYARGASSWTA
jgi:2-dehydropantoate 2-reductase